jgi:hypothetical protein
MQEVRVQGYGFAVEDRDLPQDPKIGFKAEQVRLRASELIVNPLAILCLLSSWRIFWMSMMNRTMPEAAPELAFTSPEIYLVDQLLDKLVPRKIVLIALDVIARIG